MFADSVLAEQAQTERDKAETAKSLISFSFSANFKNKQ